MCSRATWAELKEHGVFLRRVKLQIDSDRANIDLQIDGVYGETRRSISNCPTDISCLAGLISNVAESHVEMSQIERTSALIELLQTELSDL